jgi:hypothetical protein
MFLQTTPQHVCGFAYVVCFMKAGFAVLCFEVERYFFMYFDDCPIWVLFLCIFACFMVL